MVMDSFRITKRAWKLAMEKIQKLLDAGESQASVGKLVGCNRATVNRWLLDIRGGENTSFKNMIRILDGLQIPLEDVFDTGEGSLPPPSPDRAPAAMDKVVSSVMMDVAKAMGKDFDAIADNLETLSVEEVKDMLKGRWPMRVSDFIEICQAIGGAPEVVIGRAVEISKK